MSTKQYCIHVHCSRKCKNHDQEVTQPRPQALMRYRVTEGGLEPSAMGRRRPRRIFPPNWSGDVTFDYTPAEDDWEGG